RSEAFYFAKETVDVEARHARQLFVRERLGRDEERHHELVERKPGLAHEPAQRSRAAEATEPSDRKRAHTGMVRRSLLRTRAPAASRAWVRPHLRPRHLPRRAAGGPRGS